MKTVKSSSRWSARFIRLALAVVLTVVALQGSPTASASTGFGGEDCAQFCEELCDYSRFQCYDMCSWNHPPGSQALDDCNWNCSISGGVCRATCEEHCW